MAKKFIRKVATVGAAGLGAYVLFFRHWQHRWGASDEEVKRTLPGDELVPHADVVETRVVTIKATPAATWPWLVQIGQGRAGYYSYERLENLAGLKMKNAEASMLTGSTFRSVISFQPNPAARASKCLPLSLSERWCLVAAKEIRAFSRASRRCFPSLAGPSSWFRLIVNTPGESLACAS
jgi:hypothetical protein